MTAEQDIRSLINNFDGARGCTRAPWWPMHLYVRDDASLWGRLLILLLFYRVDCSSLLCVSIFVKSVYLFV